MKKFVVRIMPVYEYEVKAKNKYEAMAMVIKNDFPDFHDENHRIEVGEIED